MIYYTADLHFGHKNVLDFDGRPFETIEEHDQFLIERWNARVKPDDQVYIVGDFCMRAKRSPLDYLKQLKGRKYLIKGNHDSALLKDPEIMEQFELAEKMYFIKDRDYRIVLCHFPLAEWNQYYRGSWHIYGHIHNKRNQAFQYMRGQERALNAGVMINNYEPVTMEELIANNQAFKGEEPETDDIEYMLSEYAQTGVIYHYYVKGLRDHAHTFAGVLQEAFYNAASFEIRDEDKIEYSNQELSWLETLVKKEKRNEKC